MPSALSYTKYELRSDFVQKYIVPSVNQIYPIHLELDFVPTKPKPIERLAFAISKEKCSQCFHRCHTTIPSPPSPRRASPALKTLLPKHTEKELAELSPMGILAAAAEAKCSFFCPRGQDLIVSINLRRSLNVIKCVSLKTIVINHLLHFFAITCAAKVLNNLIKL